MPKKKYDTNSFQISKTLLSILEDEKLAKEEIRKSQERFHALIEHSSDIITLIDSDGIIRFESPSVERVLGYKPEELIGCSMFDFIHPEDKNMVLATLANGVQKPRFITAVELRFRHKDGEWRFLEATGNNLLSIPAIAAVVINSRDITQRKQAEDTLRQSEIRLIEAQRIAKMGDFTWDVKTGEVTWSDALFDLLHYNKSEKIDYVKVNAEIHHPEDLERVTIWLNDCISSGKGELTPNEYRLIRKDGKILHIRTQGVIKYSEDKSPKVFATVQDITERKLAEEKLQESEQKVRTLMSNLPGMAYRCINNRNWTMNYVSAGCRLLTGYKPADIVNDKVIAYGDIIHPEDREKVWKSVQKAVEKGKHFELEYRIISKNKKIKWVWERGLNVTIKNDANGTLEGFISDITARKYAEEALKESELRFSTTFKLNPFPASLTRVSDSKLTEVNEAWCSLMGFSKEESIGNTIEELKIIDQNTRSKIREEYLQKKSLRNVEVTITTRNGEKRDILSSMEKIRFGSEEFVLNLIVDITERKRSEAERERLNAAIEQAAEAVVITDIQGKIEYVNPVFERVTGYSRTETIGNTPRILKSGRHDESFYRNLWDTISNGNVWTGQFVNRRKDGNLFTEEATISPVFNSAGKIVNYVAVKRDITRELELEQQYL